ncbi:MAG: hypothetical protein AAF823_15950 [Planctomycetota bacterium]
MTAIDTTTASGGGSGVLPGPGALPGAVDTSAVDRVLGRARMKDLGVRVLRGVAGSASVGCVAVCVAVAGDAATGWSIEGLIAWGASVLGLMVVAIGWWWLRAMRGVGRKRWAEAIERGAGLAHSELVNTEALARARRRGTTGMLSAELADRAIERGNAAARSIDVDAIVRWSRCWRAVAAAVVIVTALGAGIAAWPGVFAASLPRLIDPFGDHPPYTPVRFDIAVDPAEPTVGDPLTLRAELAAPAPPTNTRIVIDRPQRGRASPDAVTRAMPAAASRFGLASSSFAITLPPADQPFRFHIATDQGRSAWQTVRPQAMPRLRAAHATIIPPAYANRPAERIALPADLRAHVGSTVTFDALAQLPLADAHLTLEPLADTRPTPALPHATPRRLRLTLDANDPAHAAVTLTVKRSADYALQLVGPTGLTMSQPVVGTLTALPDEPPTVAIASPAPHVRVVVGYPVPIRVAAEDDLGLARLTLTVQRPDQPATTHDLALDSSDRNATTTQATHTLDTAALGLQPGDRLTYTAEATDNHPDHPQSARTAPHTVEVITLQEFQQTLTTMSSAPPQLIAPGNANNPNDRSQPGNTQAEPNNANAEPANPNNTNNNAQPNDPNAQPLDPANAQPADAACTAASPGACTSPACPIHGNAGASPSPNASASPGSSPSSAVGSGAGTGFGTAGPSAPGNSAGIDGVGLIGPGSPHGNAPLNTPAPDAPTTQPPPDAAIEFAQGAEADATNLAATLAPPVLRADRTEAFNPAAARTTPTDPIADPAAAPPAYRDEAAAYFRRLADDAATTSPDAPPPN